MRNIIIAIVVLGIVGGSVYFFTKNKAIAPEQNNNEQVNITNSDGGGGNPSNVDVSVTVPATPINVPAVTNEVVVATKTFTMSGSNFSFDLKTIEVSKGDKVKIVFKNTSGNHDLRIEGYGIGTKVLSGGAEETFEFIADKAGSFEYYCSVGSHRAMGMKGMLVVK